MTRLSPEEHKKRYASARAKTGQGRENVGSASGTKARKELQVGRKLSKKEAGGVSERRAPSGGYEVVGQSQTPMNANMSGLDGNPVVAPAPDIPQAEESTFWTSLRDKILVGDKVRELAGLEPLPDTGEPLGGSPIPLSIGAGGAAYVASQAGRLTRGTSAANQVSVGTATNTAGATSTAATVAKNTKNAQQTASWLNKLAGGGLKGTIITGEIMGAIGTYPFAGFIKEEALQTAGFATKTALDNGDFAGAEEALALQEEMLNPDLWDKIKAGIPFVNVIDQINNFLEAAALKVDIDRRLLDDLRNYGPNASPENLNTAQPDSSSEESSWDSFYANIDADREAKKEEDRAEAEAYWAEIERQRQAAKAAEREADEAYWASVLEQREAREAEAREADEAYWTEYYKRLQQYREDNTPSKLNFGLL